MMLKGVNQWCFPEGTPLKQLFEVSQQAGFDTVELNLNPDGGVGLTKDTTAEEARQIAQLARDYNIQLPSISTSLLGRSPLSSPDPSVREQGRNVAVRLIELASEVGADTVLIVPGRVNETTSYEEVYERSRIELEKVIPIAEKHNIRMGIENVWNKFLLSPLEMKKYVEDFDSSQVGVYFDVGNIVPYGFPEQWIRYLGSHIFKIHVKDFRRNVGTGAGFVPLLSGDVNWPEVMKSLNEVNYDGPLTAEIGIYPQSPLQAVYDTSRQLDAILAMT